MELPREIWDVIIRNITYNPDNGPVLKACSVILPQVCKQFNSICQPLQRTIWLAARSVRPEAVSKYFANTGLVSCLKFSHETGCAWNSQTLMGAVMYGHYEVVDYALSHGCAYNYEMRITAGKYGRLKILEYIDQHYTPLSEKDLKIALKGKFIDCVKYIVEHRTIKSLPAWIVDLPSDEILQYLQSKGLRPTTESLLNYYKIGNMNAFKYTHESGMEWPPNICNICTEENNLECLKYAHEHGAQWADNTCTIASTLGSSRCLAYAHENGCSWDRQQCLTIALDSFINAVKVQDKYRWAGSLPPVHNDAGMVRCIQYLLVHEDKWDPNIVLPPIKEQQRICKEFLIEKKIRELTARNLDNYFLS